MKLFDKFVAWVSEKQYEYRELQGYIPRNKILRTPESIKDCTYSEEKFPDITTPVESFGTQFSRLYQNELLKDADLSKCESALPDHPGGALHLSEEEIKQEPVPELIKCNYCGSPPIPSEEEIHSIIGNDWPKVCIYRCSNDFCEYQPYTKGYTTLLYAAEAWNKQDVRVQPAERKPIQIFNHGLSTGALCDDGTMWLFDQENEEWKQVKAPPRRKFKIN